jgi:hypothetical protein
MRVQVQLCFAALHAAEATAVRLCHCILSRLAPVFGWPQIVRCILTVGLHAAESNAMLNFCGEAGGSVHTAVICARLALQKYANSAWRSCVRATKYSKVVAWAAPVASTIHGFVTADCARQAAFATIDCRRRACSPGPHEAKRIPHPKMERSRRNFDQRLEDGMRRPRRGNSLCQKFGKGYKPLWAKPLCASSTQLVSHRLSLLLSVVPAFVTTQPA